MLKLPLSSQLQQLIDAVKSRKQIDIQLIINDEKGRSIPTEVQIVFYRIVQEALTEAVELCAQVQPDVVLMDLKMPIMDGVTATKIIGQKYPSIRVIALTSFDEEPLMQSAKQAGVYDYLLKNVTIDNMANIIRKAYVESKSSS